MSSECSNALVPPLRTFAAYLKPPNIFRFVTPIRLCSSEVSFLRQVAGSREFQVLVLLELSRQERVLLHLCLFFPGCWLSAQTRGICLSGDDAALSVGLSRQWKSFQPGLSGPPITTTPGFIQMSPLKSGGNLRWECRNGKVKPRY